MSMTDLERAELRDFITDHEGVKLSAYPDHLGYLTIGVGRLIDSRKGGGITVAEALYLLDNDLDRCIADLSSFPWWAGLDTMRQRALIDMRFQLGRAGFRGFVQMIAALGRGAFADAAQHARDSAWATQTPARARTITAMLDTGQFQKADVLNA